MATWRHGGDRPRPDGVGILALEVYFPTQMVRMSDMEAADGCPGKYTIGLGQEEMSFCSDREDAVSLALTAAHSLLEKYGVRPEEVGHLQVATESGVDRSKSIKSHLMRLFQQPQQQQPPPQHRQQQQPESEEQNAQREQQPQVHKQQNGHGSSQPPPVTATVAAAAAAGPPAEGVDYVHACFGGTAALMAAVAWVESRRWDGRLALVVTADVALYAPGSAARPTGGCGAAAFLVGPNAPLVLDPLWYGTHAEDAWDFYKPLGSLPYPSVDGALTLSQYMGSAGQCALRLAARLRAAGELAEGEGLLRHVAHFVSHAPLNKLVRKGLARVALMDELRRREAVAVEAKTEVAAAAAEAEAGAAEAAKVTEAVEPGGRCHGSGEAAPAGLPTGEGQGEAQAQQPLEWVQEWVREEEQQGGSSEAAIGEGRLPPETATSLPADAPAGPEPSDSPSRNTAAAAAASPSPQGPPPSPPQQQPLAAPPLQDLVTSSASPLSLPEVLGAGEPPPLPSSSSPASCAGWRLADKAMEGRLGAATAALWREKGEDAAWLQKQVGNSYTASVWQGLASLVWRRGEAGLAGSRLLLYSFGSGTIAALFSVVARGGGDGRGGNAGGGGCGGSSGGGGGGGSGGGDGGGGGGGGDGGSCMGAWASGVAGGAQGVSNDNAGQSGPSGQSGTTDGPADGPRDPRFTLATMQRVLDLGARLGTRVGRPVSEFDAVAAQIEASYRCAVPYEPRGDLADVAVGSYYLAEVDGKSRRRYERKV